MKCSKMSSNLHWSENEMSSSISLCQTRHFIEKTMCTHKLHPDWPVRSLRRAGTSVAS